jgi:MFS family permease
LAIAIQNLAWCIATPLFGACAEKFGDKKAIFIGIILYAVGLLISSQSSSPSGHQLLNIVIGFSIAGTGFGPILAVVGRTTSPENRSLALGITTAAGSAGQIIGPLLTSILLETMSWSSVFIIFAFIILFTMILLPLIKVKDGSNKINNHKDENLGKILIKAFKDPTYMMIFLGFFSCGFQLAFITAHFPAFIVESSFSNSAK